MVMYTGAGGWLFVAGGTWDWLEDSCAKTLAPAHTTSAATAKEAVKLAGKRIVFKITGPRRGRTTRRTPLFSSRSVLGLGRFARLRVSSLKVSSLKVSSLKVSSLKVSSLT
jgi:hypothetical protein